MNGLLGLFYLGIGCFNLGGSYRTHRQMGRLGGAFDASILLNDLRLRGGSFFILHLPTKVIHFLGLDRLAACALFFGNHCAVRLGIVVEARGNQGNTEGFAETFVGAVTPNNIGVVAASVLGDFENLVHFVERDLVGT